MRLIGIAALVSVARPVYAGPRWEKSVLERTAAPADEEAVVEYALTNVGPEAVTIQSVHSSCGCTTAALDKKVYQPGESGRITVTLT